MNQRIKKWHVVSLALLMIVLTVLAVTVVGADDTVSDPLVSLSFLNGKYRTEILSEVDTKIQQEATAVAEKVNTQISAVKLAPSQQNVQPTHTTVTIAASTSYVAPTGSEFLVLSGALTPGSATLTDVGAGARIGANEALEVNHLYVATASTTLRATQTAQILIRKP